MDQATLTSKGQITIPKRVRTRLHVDTGDRIDFIEVAPGRFEIVAATKDIRRLKGIVGKAEKRVSIEDMDRAIAGMGQE